MDPATLIGILLAFGALVAMITMEGSAVTAILLPAPMLLVFVGTIAVGFAGGTVADSLRAIRALPSAFRGKPPRLEPLIVEIVDTAALARREGLLALDRKAEEELEPFMKGALRSVADGADGKDLSAFLDEQIESRSRALRQPAKWFKTLGGYAPTVGIIGTVVSLTHVLENLSTPEELGPLIASAFIATLWGLLSANFIWLPISDRLNRLAELEVDRMTVIAEGMISIQAGAQPQLIGERLRALAPDLAQPART